MVDFGIRRTEITPRMPLRAFFEDVSNCSGSALRSFLWGEIWRIFFENVFATPVAQRGSISQRPLCIFQKVEVLRGWCASRRDNARTAAPRPQTTVPISTKVDPTLAKLVGSIYSGGWPRLARCRPHLGRLRATWSASPLWGQSSEVAITTTVGCCGGLCLAVQVLYRLQFRSIWGRFLFETGPMLTKLGPMFAKSVARASGRHWLMCAKLERLRPNLGQVRLTDHTSVGVAHCGAPIRGFV